MSEPPVATVVMRDAISPRSCRKCDSLEAKLAALRQTTAMEMQANSRQSEETVRKSSLVQFQKLIQNFQAKKDEGDPVQTEDVLQWAEAL